jgi:hypothetical protein
VRPERNLSLVPAVVRMEIRSDSRPQLAVDSTVPDRGRGLRHAIIVLIAAPPQGRLWKAQPSRYRGDTNCPIAVGEVHTSRSSSRRQVNRSTCLGQKPSVKVYFRFTLLPRRPALGRVSRFLDLLRPLLGPK